MSGPYLEQNSNDLDAQVLEYSDELDSCINALTELIRLMTVGEIPLLGNAEFEQLIRHTRPLTALASQMILDSYDPIDY